MSSMDGDSLLETMTCAANALQHRVAAGRSQLTAAMLSSDVKRAVIDNAITHMTGDCPAAEFTVRSVLNVIQVVYLNFMLFFVETVLIAHLLCSAR